MPFERFNFVGAYFSWLMDSYDLGAVVITSAILGKLFFPSLGLLGAAIPIVFTVVSRPLGGFLFGLLADKRGRRYALIFTVLGYSASIGLTGVLPTYAQIGVGAAILLSVLRLTQGLFIGGDVSSSFTLAMESATSHRGFFSGLMQSGTLAGFVIADTLFTVLSSQPWFPSFGWRVVFLVGVIPAALAILIRAKAVEPKIFLDREKKSIYSGLRPLLQTLMVMVGFWLMIYAGPQYLSIYFGHVLSYRPQVYGTLLIYMNLIGIAAMLLAGELADLMGRRLIAITGLVIAGIVGAIFYQRVTDSPLFYTLMFGFGVNIPSAISPAYLAERFKTFSRATGVGSAYNGAFVVSGFAPIMISALSGLLPVSEAATSVLLIGVAIAVVGLIAGPETLRVSELRN
ncbi:MFS transporter [Sulfodiicoccus acidiphilus]|uniref:MFS transporter n=1 Tax=Sulfodiicoccus acidiphilus TaxID=1670455 RepID=A0A348B0B1_9CREN|nr:MFS transporter [Sulfodiicoccus acidiphilus]BBD71613.1 MFS transporter [Sulfodiicoccus acidiphilus]GGT87087.1 MFS transporter [Sulfodiicoccus acidiphilus]